MLGKCRCGAPLLWVRTVRGKRIALDTRPAPDGNVYLHAGQVAEVLGRAQLEHLAQVAELSGRRVPLYSCHWAGCPRALRQREPSPPTPNPSPPTAQPQFMQASLF